MPRGPRISFENAFYHVFNRGINKEVIFRNSKDYKFFLHLLEKLPEKGYDHAIYAYVLMPNHFHLLIQSKLTPISKIMASLLTAYSMYFNKTYNRVGVVFQNRFKSKLCEMDSYFLGASAYIHLNPLKDHLVVRLDDYPWSSYQELYGLSQFHILNQKEIKRLIGESLSEKQGYYKFLMQRKEILDEKEYDFSAEIEGRALFNRLSQIKYLRRQKDKLDQVK